MTILKEKVASFPISPGVYLMKDLEGNILYIGKALALRKRVQSYFRPHPDYPKIDFLMGRVCDIDYIETSTEVDALLLEARLIREYQPRYNKELKDDKSYPLLKITRERFPRIHVTRNKTDRQAVYYGPFTDAKLLREAIALIHNLFPIRKCQKLPKTACLYYHIGQCLAPCIKPSVKPEYDRVIEEVRAFIGSGKRSFVDYLSERMNEAAEELRFEDAQYFKEQIQALSRLKRKRFLAGKPEAGIRLAATVELKRLLQMEKLPEKIVCFDVSNIQGDEAVASRVSFYRELADKVEYRRYKIKTVSGINDYAMIQEALRRMICGIKEGRESFLPDVIMIDGGKGHLRAALEVLKEEDFENVELISIAKRFEIVYHATGRRPEREVLKGQRLTPPSGTASGECGECELQFAALSPAHHLLEKIRDEAHHFAISYHRLLKEKNLSKSVLDPIPGIGENRKRILLTQFDSIEELKRAGLEQLEGIPGIGPVAGKAVWQYFHPPQK